MSIINQATMEEQEIWKKEPYPPMVDHMYGFTKFMVNLNYLPSKLAKVIAPTDSRFRPDQRALENGEMKLASSEKNRLEEK